jgi:hypothetical protein
MLSCWQHSVLLLLQVRVRLVAAAEVVLGVVLLLALARSVARCGSTTGAHQLLALALLVAGALLLPLVAVLLVAEVVVTLPLLVVVAGLGKLVLCWQVLVA